MNLQRRAKGAGGHRVVLRRSTMKEAANAAALYTTPPAEGECANRKAIGGWGGNACAISQRGQWEAQ